MKVRLQGNTPISLNVKADHFSDGSVRITKRLIERCSMKLKRVLTLGLVFVVVVLAVSISSASAESKKLANFNSTNSIPGVKSFDKRLTGKLLAMKEKRGHNYKPRTRHLNQDGSAKYTNRLFLESSPYLLQHAHNPVNWYPWGDEAFETARKLKLPVLLSIGYSTCHWCHVMEEESFEDEEIARYLNENYIAIKVDREERPDVDGIYMAAVQAMTGGGGWPMNTWLTPDRMPFYGGTYFPARDGDRGARVGFYSLLKQIKSIYNTQPDKVAQQSQQLANYITRTLGKGGRGKDLPTAKILRDAFDQYKSAFDPIDGGISRAPKFPSSLPIRFLLRYNRRTSGTEALNMATLTLKKMAGGGMYDHVGGGFHRYSTDSKWLVPHFEKMLYDNALLAMGYLEGYQATGDEDFLRVTQEILRYVTRDMTSPEGAFYSATDADSLTPSGHREEGYFFTWTPKELDQILSKETAAVVKAYYAVSDSGNFEGRNILNTPKDVATVAKQLKISEEKLQKVVNDAKEVLYQARNPRPQPIRDEKVLTAWNGLMISAYARAGLILGDNDYIERAVIAAGFIKKNLYADGRLFRSYKDGMRKYNAYLDDYAFYIAALLDLYEATYDFKWFNFAVELDNTLAEHYEDHADGGFFMTSDDHENLLVREKPAYDGAEPCGNSVAVLNLLRLLEFTTDDAYRKRAENALKAFHQNLTQRPTLLSEMVLAVDFYLDKPKEVVIVAPKNESVKVAPFMNEFRRSYLPNKVLMVLTEGDELEEYGKAIPLVQGKRALNDKVTAYVCEQGICKLPARDPKTFMRQIAVIEKLKD